MSKNNQLEHDVSYRADPVRISSMLTAIADISDPAGGHGVTRLAYTDKEREAHSLVTGWLRDLGLTVYTDVAGNTIAERPGKSVRSCIATGSHLDSVPHGGRFDGIVGVVAAVEIARLLVENDIDHDHAIRFVAFAAEEGARFGQGCIGSKAAGGMWSAQALESMHDNTGTTIAQAMNAVGLDAASVASAAWSPDDWNAFLELHIEQGQVLESHGTPIGIVDLISGSTRFELIVDGVASHTGSTPMELRADALTAASEIVLLAEEIANDPRHQGTRCTVGRLQVDPGSITTIPGRVTMWIDVRDIDTSRQRLTADEIVRRGRAVCDRRGVKLSVRLLSDASPVVLPSWVRKVTESVCRDQSTSYRVMNSGASHDTQMVNNTIPAGLIFVPSRGGLSHVPGEWSEASHIAHGADILLRTLLALDAELVKRAAPAS